MSIFDKIEEIRRKPEHIRMRYVWLCVGISMLFVIAFWIFSLQGQNKPAADNTGSTDILNQFNQQKSALDNIRKDMPNNAATTPPTNTPAGNSDSQPTNNSN